MEVQPDWKAQLSFSDRIATTLKLSDAFQKAFSEPSSLEARVEARKVEDAALQQASTKSEYEKICQQTITGYLDLSSKKDLSDEDTDQVNTPAPESEYQIGPYKHCVYHRSGLFSTIYKSRSPSCTSLYAIKETIPSTQQPPHNSPREARLLRKATHPNVVKLLEVNRLTDGRLLMSFPYMPNTLEDVLLSETSIVTKGIVAQLFHGLAHLHDLAGILHRDLKPSNILLTRQPTPIPEYNLCIADFGIAWHADDPASEPAEAKITDIGTTCYRAPELLFGYRDYKEGIDLWSAGCVVAEILMHNVRLGEGSFRRDWTLFDAGELGSELALVKSIFETLGTPNAERWPESKSLPDWGKMSFVEYPTKPWPTILPSVDDFDRNLVANLVRYQSTERVSAQKVCEMLGI